MKEETFEKAKFLMDKISQLTNKKLQIQQMKERENDEEFNSARQFAEDSIHYAICQFEADFNDL